MPEEEEDGDRELTSDFSLLKIITHRHGLQESVTTELTMNLPGKIKCFLLKSWT